MEGPYLRMKELAPYLNLAPATLFDWLDPNSPRYDDTFPASVQLGQRAVGWSKAEIDEWCSKRQFARNSGETRQAKTKKARKPAASSSTKPTARLASPEIADWDYLIASQERDQYLLELLREQSWTPVMAALLASGLKAPRGCAAIPETATRLDGESDSPIYLRRINATTILRDWEDYVENLNEANEGLPNGNPLSTANYPIDFLEWFDEEEIDTPWIRLIRRLAGCPMQDDPQSFKLVTSNVPVTLVVHAPVNHDSQGDGARDPLPKPRIHSSKTRRNMLDSAIDKAIASADNYQTDDVFFYLKELALSQEPPFKGTLGIDGGLLYNGANNEEVKLTRSMLSSRLQRRRKKMV